MENEMNAELRFHIETYAEDLIRGGVPRFEAMRRARVESGGIERAEEECRDARGPNLVESLIQDLRYALRTARRSLGFTAAAFPTLALGIGAPTAIFSVVKVVILNPLPFHQPENLVHVWEGHEHYHRGDRAYFSTARPASLYDWRAQSRSLESITAYRWRPMLLTDDKRPELVSAQDVCDQFFETLGTPAHLGRTLEAPDYEPSAAHVVVIGNAMWVNRLGADPRVIGRRISLNRESYEIVGVMPSGFYPAPNYRELWTPHWALQAEKDAQNVWGLFPLARLKPGVTWQQVQTAGRHSARVLQDHRTLESVGGTVVPMDAQFGRLATHTVNLTPEQAPSLSGQSNSGSIPGKFSVFVWHRNLRQLRTRTLRLACGSNGRAGTRLASRLFLDPCVRS
jgi:MacB-like periplasmic core domain